MIKKTTQKIITWFWLKYYTILWCIRCYGWNLVKLRIEKFFDKADWWVRIRVGKALDALDK